MKDTSFDYSSHREVRSSRRPVRWRRIGWIAAGGVFFIGLVKLLAAVLAVAALSSCVTWPQPCSNCAVTPVPTQGPPPTPTMVPVATPTPKATPAPFQAARGRAMVHMDLRRFAAAPPDAAGNQLDKYAGATLLWEVPPRPPAKPRTPAMELQIAGVGPELCENTPCGRTALGLVVRWSMNVENLQAQCGEGINAGRRLPIGPHPVFDVLVEWQDGLVRASTLRTDGSVLASWSSRFGIARPGLGLFFEGVPNDGQGIGWERYPWVLQAYGGAVTLTEWTGEPGAIGQCP